MEEIVSGAFNDDISKNSNQMVEPESNLVDFCRSQAPVPWPMCTIHDSMSISFASKLLQVNLDSSQKSFVVSPYTMQTTFGMCFMGAESLTKNELNEVVFASDHRVGTYLADLTKSASAIDSLRTATRLLCTHRAEYYSLYRKKFRIILDKNDTYNWGVAQAHFESGDYDRMAEALDKTINKKLAGLEMANGTLTKEFFDPSLRLLILQAFSYHTKWQTPFEPALITDNLFFKSATDSGVPVEYMQQSGSFRYYEDARWKILRMAITTKKSAVYFMLPTNRRDITSADFETIYQFRKCSLQNVKVILPKFRLESPWHDISDQMKKLGLIDSFKHMRANFCNMVRVYDLENGFGISKMIEKSSFQLDEGNPESTVESERVDEGSPVSEAVVFRADSPFLFFLVHEGASYTILLAGRYAGP